VKPRRRRTWGIGKGKDIPVLNEVPRHEDILRLTKYRHEDILCLTKHRREDTMCLTKYHTIGTYPMLN